MSTFNSHLPNMVSSGSVESQVQELRQLVFNLSEQLRYSTENIDETNFSIAYKEKIKTIEEASNGLIDIIGDGSHLDIDALNDRYEQLRKLIISTATEITQVFNVSLEKTLNSIISRVDEEYTAKSTTASLQSLLTSMIEQTSQDVQMKFNEAHSYAVSVNGVLTDFKQTLETYIRFSSEGITIGKRDSPFKAKFDNRELGFYQNEVKIAYFSNNKLYVVWVETQKLTIGSPANGYIDIEMRNGKLTGNWR